MRTEITSERSQLNRLALANSWAIGEPVEAYLADGGQPTFIVGNKVVVNTADRELMDYLVRRGGRIASTGEDPPMPEEFRRLGLGRDPEVDMSAAPRIAEIRFDDVPPATMDADAVIARAWPGAERMRWTSEPARALAALVAPMRAEGRRVGLDEVMQPRTLPLSVPREGSGLSYDADPLTWKCMNQKSRIADAWHLVESMRSMRSVSPVEFIGICDNGFDPGAANDIGLGTVSWNSVADVKGLPPPPLIGGDFHGTEVASAAGATVGNTFGAAGSGGTVSALAFFYSFTKLSVLKTVKRCTQWGIHILNISNGFLVDQDDIEEDWVDTFNWATDNGVLIVAAAPNDKVNMAGNQGDFPSTVTGRVLAVGRLTEEDTASDCAYGPGVDIWAPGTQIPVVPYLGTPMGSFANGTSMAAPLVSGVAAMMRAVNPALSPDQLRDILLKTAWTGPGPQDRGMNAYAALLEVMHTSITENAFETPPERLFPAADGTFKPLFNKGFNRAVDVDTFLFDIKSFSRVTVDLRWYERTVKSVTLGLENTADDSPVQSTLTNPGPGVALLAADVGSGTYRLSLRGTGTSAYLLAGRIAPARLEPDRFEPNDSFETATRLRILPRGKWEIGGIFNGPWGPGSFNLNLHTDGTGPGTRDEDYFVVDVPSDVGVLREPQVQITHSDEVVDVTLFDAARHVLLKRSKVRSTTLRLELGKTFYVKVSGAMHTRYGLWAGAHFEDQIFHKLWPEVQVLPNWWEENVIDNFVNPQEQRAIVLTPELVEDGILVIGGVSGRELPEGVHIGLHDRDGSVIRESTMVNGQAVIDLEGLREGAYIITTALQGKALRAAQSGGLAISSRPPRTGSRSTKLRGSGIADPGLG